MHITAPEKSPKKLDWRITLGCIISFIWLSLLFLYLSQQVNWQLFLNLPLDQIGSFLGGAFSPLALLWLVIGFFIQQEEIQENTRNIEIQAQHTNLDNFLKMSQIIYQHTSVITGLLYVSCSEEIEAATGEPLNMSDKWSRSGNGDLGIFARELLSYRFDTVGDQRDMTVIYYSTPIRRKHIANFIEVFEKLLADALVCDPTESLHSSLMNGSVWGLLYKAIIDCDNPYGGGQD